MRSLDLIIDDKRAHCLRCHKYLLVCTACGLCYDCHQERKHRFSSREVRPIWRHLRNACKLNA